MVEAFLNTSASPKPVNIPFPGAQPDQAVQGPAQAALVTMPIPQTSPATQLVHMIERFLRDPSIDVHKLEALVKMQKEAREAEARESFYNALGQFQQLGLTVERRGRIIIRDKNNKEVIIQSTPFALWEDIHKIITPKLSQLGLVLSFRTGSSADGKVEVTCVLAGHGHQETTSMALPYDTSGSKNNVQAIGSSTSYGKRYTACSMLNIITVGEDDDGKASAGNGLSEEEVLKLANEIERVGADEAKFLAVYGITELKDLSSHKLDEAFAKLLAFEKRQAKAQK